MLKKMPLTNGKIILMGNIDTIIILYIIIILIIIILIIITI